MDRGFLYVMFTLALIVSLVNVYISLFLAVIVLVVGLNTPGNGRIGVCLSLIIIVPLTLLLLLTIILT